MARPRGVKRELTPEKIQAIKAQTLLFDYKIFMAQAAALATARYTSSVTRNLLMIAISHIKPDDKEFHVEEVSVPEACGGAKRASKLKYEKAKKEIALAAGDGLVIELEKDIEAVAHTFFDSRVGVTYDERKHKFRYMLNPALSEIYLFIKKNFSVLMLSEYLRLGWAFQKDLYVYLIAHQGKTDFPFSKTVEDFCNIFDIPYCLKHRDDLVDKLTNAKREIEALTELRFDFTPHYEETKGKKLKQRLTHIKFVVHTGPYYLFAKEAQEKRAAAAAAEIEATKDKKGIVFDATETKEKPLSEIEVEMVERDIEEERQREEYSSLVDEDKEQVRRELIKEEGEMTAAEIIFYRAAYGKMPRAAYGKMPKRKPQKHTKREDVEDTQDNTSAK